VVPVLLVVDGEEEGSLVPGKTREEAVQQQAPVQALLEEEDFLVPMPA